MRTRYLRRSEQTGDQPDVTPKNMTTLRCIAFFFLFGAILLSLAPATAGRDTIDIRQPTTTAAGKPATCATTHAVSKIALTVSNFGTLGSFYLHAARWTIDCFTGDRAPSCEYPRHSGEGRNRTKLPDSILAVENQWRV